MYYIMVFDLHCCQCVRTVVLDLPCSWCIPILAFDLHFEVHERQVDNETPEDEESSVEELQPGVIHNGGDQQVEWHQHHPDRYHQRHLTTLAGGWIWNWRLNSLQSTILQSTFIPVHHPFTNKPTELATVHPWVSPVTIIVGQTTHRSSNQRHKKPA